LASEQEKLKDGKKTMAEHASEKEHEPSAISPYTTRALTVSIGESGAKYTLLEAIVHQYSGLKQRIDPKSFDTPIELREVDEDIGHTLIHYIYTGRYQTLGLDSIPSDLRTTIEFKRSVLAYCSALLCGIETLEELTKAKMEELSKELSIFDIQLVVEEVTPKLPQNDDWFPEQMQTWIKCKLMADDTLLIDGRLLDAIGRSALFDKAVVKGITEMYSEQVAKVKDPIGGRDHAPLDQDTTPKSRQTNGITAAAAREEESRQDSAVPSLVNSSPRNGVESVKPAEISSHDVRTSRVESRPTQNSSDVGPLHSEEAATETPSESWTGLSEDHTKMLPEEPLDALRRRSEANGNPAHGENLKGTDSEGDVSKPKLTKKAKKAKKRKDSISVANI